jgi:protein phosphatase 1H
MKANCFTLYFRAVNAGKSLRNEDQARIHVGYLERKYSGENGTHETTEFHTPPSTPEKDTTQTTSRHRHRLPYVYFALFDGHAGTGAAISASHELHCILYVSCCLIFIPVFYRNTSHYLVE